MEKEVAAKKKFDLSSYAAVVGFLALEVLAFLGFSLGQNFVLYGSLLLALIVLLVIVVFRQIKVEGLSNYAFFLFPIFIYSLLSALSIFAKYSVGAIGLTNSIFIPIALTFAGLSGYFVSHIKGFDLQKAFLVIYGALAIFVLINLILTMVYYVPFYTLRYSNSYLFYDGKLLKTYEDIISDGKVVSISETAYMLFGFEAVRVTLTYWSLYPMVLCTSAIGLFYVNYKKNRKLFLTYLFFTVLGGLSLLLTISKTTLIADIVLLVTLALIILFIKVKKSRKPIRIGLIVLLVLFVIGFLMMFLNAQTSWKFLKSYQDFIKNNRLFNRLFNTSFYFGRIYSILCNLFTENHIFGAPVGIGTGADMSIFVRPSNSWFFDNFLTSGVFGAAFFVFALYIGIKQMVKYYKNSDEIEFNKALLFAFVLGVLMITGVGYCSIPIINANNLYPVYMFAPFLIVIFFISYTFKPLPKPQSEEKEVSTDEKALSI